MFFVGGRPVALEDRCAYCGMPLSMGQIEEILQCSYHGLRYGANNEVRGNGASGNTLRAAAVTIPRCLRSR
ncbi:Rieske 2Fe-2S domain-containing protein [Variovorax paradoxus]|nr:Rieske 2Fe-2S domain-containing protein [Variovorax paradoxus]